MTILLLALALGQDLEPGLVAEVFRSAESGFAPAPGRPLLARVDPQVDVPLATGELPGTRLAERVFVRWTGLLRCPADGLYGFYVESDDGCRLFVDGELVVDHRGSRMMEQKSDRVVLKAGDRAIRLEYQQLDGPAGVNLQWKTPLSKREIIPAKALFHRKGAEAVETDRAAWEALPPAAARVPVPVGRPGRYAVMDYGASLARTLAGKPEPVVYSALVVRTSPDSAIAFDTRKLRWAAAWTGSFLKFPTERDGVAGFPEIAGTPSFTLPSSKDSEGHPGGPLPRARGRWLGHYVHGSKVVLSYELAGSAILELPGREGGSFTRTLRIGPGPALELPHPGGPVRIPAREAHVLLKLAHPPLEGAPPEDPLPLTKGGPARWPALAPVKGVLGREPGAYAVDTVPVPEENPWDSYLRLSGLDFLPDGRAAVCTLDGDVWLVSGLDAGLASTTWKRFAAGLYQPMGVAVRGGEIFVLGRDQVTRLRDLNGDGEADLHENFNNDGLLSGSFHEFAMDLQVDEAGDFYYARAATLGYGAGTPHSGCVFKLSRDGSALEVFADGFRTPFGLCVGPGGWISATDQQGNWMGTSPIVKVERGAYYGFPSDQRPESKAKPRAPALAWLPMDVDNSPGGQCWASPDRWGPLQGRLIHTSYGQARIFTVLMDPGIAGVSRIPLSFASGIHRARVNPADGQLWVAGLRGWQTTGARDGCLQRVRFTGKAEAMPVAMRRRAGAIEIGFSDALDPEIAADAENWAASAFNVVSNADYGSPDYLPSDPKKRGREPWEITKASLLPDGRTVVLEIPKLSPVNCLLIKANLRSAAGTKVPVELSLTLP